MGYTQPEPLRGKHEFGEFRCGDPELDEWLLRYSRHAEAARSARTFVTAVGGKVIGYYALAIGQVDPGAATSRLKKGQPPDRAVSVLLLARLAVDQSHHGKGIGRSLLLDALLQCSS